MVRISKGHGCQLAGKGSGISVRSGHADIFWYSVNVSRLYSNVGLFFRSLSGGTTFRRH